MLLYILLRQIDLVTRRLELIHVTRNATNHPALYVTNIVLTSLDVVMFVLINAGYGHHSLTIALAFGLHLLLTHISTDPPLTQRLQAPQLRIRLVAHQVPSSKISASLVTYHYDILSPKQARLKDSSGRLDIC